MTKGLALDICIELVRTELISLLVSSCLVSLLQAVVNLHQSSLCSVCLLGLLCLFNITQASKHVQIMSFVGVHLLPQLQHLGLIQCVCECTPPAPVIMDSVQQHLACVTSQQAISVVMFGHHNRYGLISVLSSMELKK